MQKVQKTYTAEFKQEAVQLAQTSGKSIAQVARELGISDTSIHQWRKELTEHGPEAFPGSGHQTAQEEEVRRLKRELEVVKQERDILKKPSASSRAASSEIPVHGFASARVSDDDHVSCAGGFSQWILCLVQTCSQSAQPRRCPTCRESEDGFPGQSPRLWQSTCSCRVACTGHSLRPETGSSSDARTRTLCATSTPSHGHHEKRARRTSGSQPAPARLQRRSA